MKACHGNQFSNGLPQLKQTPLLKMTHGNLAIHCLKMMGRPSAEEDHRSTEERRRAEERRRVEECRRMEDAETRV